VYYNKNIINKNIDFMQIKYLIIGSLIALLLSNNISYGDTTRNTYIGVDYLYSTINMPKEFGGNLFSKKKPTPGLSVTLGHMYTQHLGAEIGFEIDRPRKNETTIFSNNSIFGIANSDHSLIYSSYNSKIKQNNIYLNITTKLKLINNVFLSLSAGASRTNIKAYSTLINDYKDDGLGGIIIVKLNSKSVFEKTKIMPFIKVNFEFSYNNYSLKLFSSWLTNFSKFAIKSKESPDSKPEFIKIKNIVKSGLGLYYYI